MHKAAQKSLEKTLEWDGAFKPFGDINGRIRFSNAVGLNLAESKLIQSTSYSKHWFTYFWVTAVIAFK